MTTIMYVSAILAVVIILTIIGVLLRYRRCKPNQVLVVYGKTGGEKKSAKLYHGGAAFVLPIIQSYDILSMEPMQIDCRLTGALSSQNIRVDVPTTITVAISTNPEIMQNAAERLLGMDTESTENLITDIVYGQMRLIIAEMTIEKLNSDRDEFLDKARKNKAIQMKLEAEAEGKKKSLMAEADGFKAMVEAAESNPQIAIQYKMVNQWKEIAGEQVKAFEHINLGNITVFDGGQNSTGNFLNNVVKTVAPALGVIDQLPIADTLKKLKGDDKK